MSDSMGSEFSPQQPEAPAANLEASGEIVASNAVKNISGKNRSQISKKLAMALVGITAPFIVSCGWGNIPNPFSRSQEVSLPPVVTPIGEGQKIPTALPENVRPLEYKDIANNRERRIIIGPNGTGPDVVDDPELEALVKRSLEQKYPTKTPETPTIVPGPIQEVTSDFSQPPQQEQSEKKELIPYSPSITIVDAAPSKPTEGLIQKELAPTHDEMVKTMLGENYISKAQIEQEFGPDYEQKWDEVVNKYPQALVYTLVDQYFGHGEKVARALESTLERSRLQSTGINILSLQEIFDKDSIELIEDSSGNPGVSLNFDQKRIIELLKNDPSRVVNGSFQVGNVELFQKVNKYTVIRADYIDSEGIVRTYSSSDDTTATFPIDSTYKDAQGNEVPLKLKEEPKIKDIKSTSLSIVGAYTKEKAMENLPKLFEVCNAYPDKFFVFAGGNTGEDFREAMEALKDQVPKNLLITAEWVKGNFGGFEYEGPPLYSYDGKFHGGVWGPNIYVNNDELGAPGGSSFSVPEIAASIDILLKKGLSFEEAKAKILASSDVHKMQVAEGTEYTALVFNPSKFQER